jgi:hypothetical protein
MKRIIITLTAVISASILAGQIIHVPGDYPTIQQGINASVQGDTVLVAPGEYHENLNLNGKNIVLCSDYALTGNLNDVMTTIINGDSPVHPDTASCILIVSGEDSTAVVEGFTITGGNGTKWEDEHGPGNFYTEGGGFLIQYSSPSIKNNIIRNNKATNYGSGIVSAGGGAIRCGDGNPHILNNLIVYNQGRYGGGLVLNYSGAEIRNNIFAWNTGGQDYGGGGLWLLSNGDSPVIVHNNTIVNNHSALGGGGIRLWSSQAQITNNIIWGNTAVNAPQIQGNTGTVTYCCVEGGWTGTGNISSEPVFLNTDFILDELSECVDSGNPEPSFNDPEDFGNPGYALYPARGTVTNDMGAFGGPGCLQIPEIITAIDAKAVTSVGKRMVVVSPNPAWDGIIRLNSVVSDDLNFTLTVKDITGMTIQSRNFNLSAFGSALLNLGSLPSETYLVKIDFANNRAQVEKLIIP